MEASLAQIPNQALIIWVLLGFLMAWMVTFAVLACWSSPEHDPLPEELPTPANSFSALHAPRTLHVVATQHVSAQVGQGTHDTGEMGTIPVA